MSYIYQEVNQSGFMDAFRVMDRYDQFGYYGLASLYAHLMDLVEGGEPLELDVIALCCEYALYNDIVQFNADYGTKCKTLEDVQGLTTAFPAGKSGAFIIQQF